MRSTLRAIWLLVPDPFSKVASIALDVKSTIYVTSAESAEVQMSAAADHRNKCRMPQVLFVKGIAILPQVENCH